MEMWVFITLVAATAQTIRFMLQKQLKSTRLSTGGATFARFVYSAPLAVLVAFGYIGLSGGSLPEVSLRFFAFGALGGIAQILGTMCVVALFAHRNFAVGIAFKKTEVILSFVVGLIILGDRISGIAFIAILIGLPGVLLLSDPPSASGTWKQRIFNKAAGIGLLSGLMFAISGVGYRGASLSIPADDGFYRAIVTLAYVTIFQTLVMSVWLHLKEKGEVGRVLASWRVSSFVGLTSMIGSTCWFWAFTLQTVALVNAVGQAEMILSIMATTLVFKEKITRREWLGGAILMLSIIILILAT